MEPGDASPAWLAAIGQADLYVEKQLGGWLSVADEARIAALFHPVEIMPDKIHKYEHGLGPRGGVIYDFICPGCNREHPFEVTGFAQQID